MVLAILFILGFTGSGWGAEPTAYEKALTAAKVKDWRKVEKMADNAIRAEWPGWPPPDTTSPDVVKKLKTRSKLFASWLQLAADAKSRRYVNSADDLSDEQRKHLKDDVKLDTDALLALDSNSSGAQTSWARVQDKEELSVKEEYKFSLSLNVAYWTWESRPDFNNLQSAHAILDTPCAGLTLNYTNEFYEWGGGGCYGAGRGSIRFNTGGYLDEHGTVNVLSGFASSMVRLSDPHAAFGLEGDLFNLSVVGKTITGTRVSANSQQLAVLGVGRFRFGRMDVKFKGGSVVDNPSAIWQVQLEFPLYHFD